MSGVLRGVMGRLAASLRSAGDKDSPASASSAPASAQTPAVPSGPRRLGDGAFELAPGADVRELGVVPGQDAGRRYAYVTAGLPLPPAGVAYVVELEGEPVTSGATRVRVLGYVDRYARVFITDDTLAMPPAFKPVARLAAPDGDGPDALGTVEIAASDGRPCRVADFGRRRDGSVVIANSRVDFGEGVPGSEGRPGGDSAPTVGRDPVEAAALCFLAFYHVPREQGIDLSTMSVADVFACLRAPDLLEGLSRILKAADVAEAHPLLRPPGILLYLARTLRATGVADVTLSDLAAGRAPSALAGLSWAIGGDEADKGPLISALPLAQQPEVRLVRTSDYANLFYVAFHRSQVSDDGARLLLEVESVLNRFCLMARALESRGALDGATEGQCAELDRWVIEDILGEGEEARTALLAPPDADAAPSASPDMDMRLAFARACEGMRLPYRLEYRFRYERSSGELWVDATVPSPRIMPHEAWDRRGGAWRDLSAAERNGDAARYAFHLAILVATAGFAAGEGVRRVFVNAWRDGWGPFGDPTCVLSVAFERGAFIDRLRASGPDASAGSVAPSGDAAPAPTAPASGTAPVANAPASSAALAAGPSSAAAGAADGADRRPADESAAFGLSAGPRDVPWYSGDPFSLVKAARHAFVLGADYALSRVRPLTELDGPDALPADAQESPEDDGRPLGPRAAAMLHAERVSDLAIYEDTPRRPLVREILAALEQDDVSEVLASVRDIHDRTENLLVRRACLRVSDGIASGVITAQSESEITAIFSDVYGLQAGLRQAVRTLAKDPMRAVSDVEGLVKGADEAGWFADSRTRAYRYFDCYASRALYAHRCGDDLAGRELRLCADEYFLAHHRLATLLSSSFDRGEDAIAHARRCVELAPSVAAAYLRLARCYFTMFDYRSEVEALKRMLRIAWNPSDVGMALYWMGYAYWMLGEKGVGMACYQRCVAFDQSLAEPVATELSEFMRKDGMRPSATLPDEEAAALFEREGVPVQDVLDNVAFLARASGAVLESGSYRLAQNLLGAAASMLHDDAMAPVIESLGE